MATLCSLTHKCHFMRLSQTHINRKILDLKQDGCENAQTGNVIEMERMNSNKINYHKRVKY